MGKANYDIVFKGMLGVSTIMNSRFIIRLDFKENKYRYQFYDFDIYNNQNHGETAEAIINSLQNKGKTMFINSIRSPVLEANNAKMYLLIKDLNAAISNKSKTYFYHANRKQIAAQIAKASVPIRQNLVHHTVDTAMGLLHHSYFMVVTFGQRKGLGRGGVLTAS